MKGPSVLRKMSLVTFGGVEKRGADEDADPYHFPSDDDEPEVVPQRPKVKKTRTVQPRPKKDLRAEPALPEPPAEIEPEPAERKVISSPLYSCVVKPSIPCINGRENTMKNLVSKFNYMSVIEKEKSNADTLKSFFQQNGHEPSNYMLVPVDMCRVASLPEECKEHTVTWKADRERLHGNTGDASYGQMIRPFAMKTLSTVDMFGLSTLEMLEATTRFLQGIVLMFEKTNREGQSFGISDWDGGSNVAIDRLSKNGKPVIGMRMFDFDKMITLTGNTGKELDVPSEPDTPRPYGSLRPSRTVVEPDGRTVTMPWGAQAARYLYHSLRYQVVRNAMPNIEKYSPHPKTPKGLLAAVRLRHQEELDKTPERKQDCDAS